jgi:alpha-1,2-mannosyltransferase
MADETCRAPNGSEMWTFGLSNKWVTLPFVIILASLPMFTLLLGPKVLFAIGRTFGYYLRKKTAGRRAQILELVAAEEEVYAREEREKGDNDEWEAVEVYTGSAKNGEKGDKEWDGIVGFFHPFWYIFPFFAKSYGADSRK